MQVRVNKWGNSLVIRLPKSISSNLNITEDSTVDMKIENNRIIISHLKININELIASITPENFHTETDTGCACGNEVW